MENKKYKFSDPSTEEAKLFKEKLDKVLSEMSLGIALVINKKEVAIKLEDETVEKMWVDFPVLMVQKKTEIVEAEIVQDGAVVSPIQKDDISSAN